MQNYSLETLLRIRQHHKTCAEQTLKDAASTQEVEEKKLFSIREKIADNKNSRAKMANSFFEKTKVSPSNAPDILALIHSAQKNIYQEESLRRDFKDQVKTVQCAKKERRLAIQKLITAHVDLKIVHNHRASWQQKIRQAEELTEQYESDDQNAIRFCLKKRA